MKIRATNLRGSDHSLKILKPFTRKFDTDWEIEGGCSWWEFVLRIKFVNTEALSPFHAIAHFFVSLGKYSVGGWRKKLIPNAFSESLRHIVAPRGENYFNLMRPESLVDDC